MAGQRGVQPPAFGVGISIDSEPTLVSFSGELDISAAATMRQVFLTPDVADATQVQIDLTETTFLDSIGMGIIVAACKRIRAKDGGVFGVTCPDGVVRRVLETAGLIDYLHVEGLS